MDKAKDCEELRDFNGVYVCAFKQIPLTEKQKEEMCKNCEYRR